jgi:hypothetical protein
VFRVPAWKSSAQRAHVSAKRYGAKLSDHFLANFRESPECELHRIPIPRTPVNKGERMSCWENTGRDEGSVPIMRTTQSVGKREVEGE